MGNSRLLSCSGVGTFGRARRHQSVGAHPFPFNPDGVNVIILFLGTQASAGSVVVRERRVEVLTEAIVNLDFLRRFGHAR